MLSIQKESNLFVDNINSIPDIIKDLLLANKYRHGKPKLLLMMNYPVPRRFDKLHLPLQREFFLHNDKWGSDEENGLMFQWHDQNYKQHLSKEV